MNTLLASFLSYILLYKYTALFVITFLGAIFPLPSGSALMAAGFFATQGYMNLYSVLFTGIAGNLLGDNIVYWGVWWHKKNISRRCHFARATQFKNLETLIEAHPFLTIFLSRFVTIIGTPVNMLAALSPLRYGIYLLFESLGEIAMTLMYGAGGYIFGGNWEYLNTLSSKLVVLLVASSLFVQALARFARPYIKKLLEE